MSKKKCIVISLSLIWLSFSFSEVSYAMTFSNPLKACTFSEMNLRITLNGQPAAGAKVIRMVDWKTESVDSFMVDDSGKVHLPAKFESSITQALPVEFVSSQVINVQYMDQVYKIWVYAKRNPKENSELEGEPLNLSCELLDDPKTERVFNSLLKTSCKFI
ncbi:DUF6795 domain-containing protein [Microbulbifer sp. 2205BS26-8]|uniref:DUF6795 domain-containing protein n=1 Tax=Microbulbifer sp. 2205BS26-8 TaxID=3064386 RepID=UPI00273D022B|nr:DUF6795 domain-containing protein [Microbulbifer sp. 2205BS26-8]MDP5210442.1 hypothetical protein [Microbulbifer sp. 2205BS26-8]